MQEHKDKRSVDDILREDRGPSARSGQQPAWFPEQSQARQQPPPRPQQKQQPQQQRPQPQPQVVEENDYWGPDTSVPAPDMRSVSGGSQDLLRENLQASQGRFAGPNDETLDLMSSMIDGGSSNFVQEQRQPPTKPARAAAPTTEDYSPAAFNSPYPEYQQQVDLPPDDLMEAMARASEDDDVLQEIQGHGRQRQRKIDPLTSTAQDATVEELLKQPPKKVYSVDSVTNVILGSVPQITEQRARWLAARIVEAHEGEPARGK